MAYDLFVIIMTVNPKLRAATPQRGLISRVPIKVATAIAPVTRASQVPAAASAAVAAQAIDEIASANVAMREEICRRRKGLRLAWGRNHSWTAVHHAEAKRMPTAATRACKGET